MARTFLTFDAITLPTGTLTVRLDYADTITLTNPGSIGPFEIGEFAERVEIKSGTIEMPSVQLTVAENYSTHAEGFWFKLFTQSVDLELPTLRFYLNEGSGDTFLFWGVVDLTTVQTDEMYISGSTYKRPVVRFTIISNLKLLEAIDAAAYIAAVATHAVDENLLAQVSDLGYTVTGGAAGTYGYRVAVRDTNYEFVWCDELVITDGPTTLDASHYIDLSWTGIGGAANYAIYRTQGGPDQGFITAGAGNSFHDDGVAAGTVGSTQSQRSCRQFVSLADFFREAVVQGLGSTYVTSLLTLDTHDVRPMYDSTSYDVESIYILIKDNYGTASGPDWVYTPYWDTADGECLLTRFGSILSLLGHICNHFAYYPRYYYDIATSRHKIELLTRGRAGSTITLDGGLASSLQSVAAYMLPRSIGISRARQDKDIPQEYAYEGINEEFDLQFALSFVCYHADSTADDYEYLYYLDDAAGIITGLPMNGAYFYNYATPDYESVTTGHILQRALGLYWYNLTYRKRRMYERDYFSIKSSGSHAGVKVLARTQITDGVDTMTFYANEVRKDITTNTLHIQWFEQ